MSKSRCITTPIYYVNDRPHIGHVYTTTLCDAWARAMRLSGDEVFFLTGTDEHGVKVEQSARDKGMDPQALADLNSAEFRKAMELFELTNDEFIRTTDPDHIRQVQLFVKKLMNRGDIYLGEFEGWYDRGQEEYITENRARELDYKSPISGKPLEREKQSNYYFRLSAYQDRLENLFAEQPNFVRPEARRNEVLGRIREGLQDVPVSRTNFSWGIPMPEDEEHVIYVWIDALFNYATALGLAEASSERYAARGHFWPADLHVIGKEILWFHAVIWPAMLMALDLPLPGGIHAHAFWISEGQKMSKSLGNFVDLHTIEKTIGHYGRDAWRWYLLTQGPLGGQDADFQREKFHETYGADLVNTFGNCASRTTAMTVKYFDGEVPSMADGGRDSMADRDWPTLTATATERWQAAINRFDLDDAAEAAINLVREVDAFINDTVPFRVAKDDSRREELAGILGRCLEAVRIAATLLHPFLPDGSQKCWEALGQSVDPEFDELDQLTAWGELTPGTKVQKVALYPRVDPLVAE